MKKNKKKAVIGVLAAGMVLIAGAMSVTAADSGSGAGRNPGRNFVDTDRDGICDNYNTDHCSKNEIRQNDRKNDRGGICGNHEARQERHLRGRCGQ